MARLYLPVPPEFDYLHNYRFLERSPKELLHRLEDGAVIKLLDIDGVKVLFRLRAVEGKLAIDFLNGTPAPRSRQLVGDYVAEWFDLKTDLKPFYAMASRDHLLKDLVKKFYGYRIIGQPDLFESVIWAVLGQQINLQFAYTLKQRFVEQFGERLFWNGQTYFLFPSAALIAGLKDEALLPLQFSRQKSLYTITIANAFASGDIDPARLKLMPLPEARDWLMRVKGIGNWTANYALMKTFRYPEAFPLEDAGVHNAIRKLKKMDRKPSLEEVKKLYRKYRGWEAYATLYLWKSL